MFRGGYGIRTFRLRTKTLCFPWRTSSFTIARPMPPVPPATAMVRGGMIG